jgi:putative transposase
MGPPIPTAHRRNFDEAGHAHELTFSCHNRHKFLAAERTCRWLAEAIETARSEQVFDLWAYVFMPEHVHLVIRPRRVPYEVAAIRKAIKEPVGREAVAYLACHSRPWLDRITRRRGRRVESLFWKSGGGYDRNVTEPRTLARMIDYIHLNPVRRGLVERAADWTWSSAGWFEGQGRNDLVPDRIPPEWSAG